MLLHMTVKGVGEPVIFLHTGLQTGETDYVHQWKSFSETHQVLLPDLRGHGNSFSDDFSNYFEDAAKDIQETMKEKNLSSAHIVGCSFGALVGIVLARRYPERVKSLTLSGVLARKPEDWARMHKEDVEHQRQLLRSEDHVQYFNQLHNTNWREFIYLARDEGWYPFDQTRDLSDLHMPILYMVGEDNPHEVRSASVYGDLPNVHVAVIPFAGHLVHQEQPELYTKILNMFLNHLEE